MIREFALLRVENLEFVYSDKPIFRAWSHNFPAGLTWIQGANGTGKSTLLRLLAGSLTPRAGSIIASHIDAGKEPILYRREVSWHSADAISFDHLTPYEYLGFFSGLYPKFSHKMANALVYSLGLSPFLSTCIKALSTGNQKKVNLAAVLAARTSIILLDEPLANLDETAATVMRTCLEEASRQRKRVWLIASHEPFGYEAEALSFRLNLP